MRSWIVIVFALSLSLSQPAGAVVGTVTEQEANPASIQRQSQTLEGKTGTGVEMNDAIRTTKGKVGITFEDKTKVQVNESSRLVIDDFVYDPNKKTGKLAVNVALGTVRYASGAIAHNSPANVAINTPSATISVRGTDFTATVDEVGASTVILLPSCPPGIKVLTPDDIPKNCKTGTIIVESDGGKVTLNKPFQATKVENRGLAPRAPVILRLGENDINNLLIVSPPVEIKKADKGEAVIKMSSLDVDFLKDNGLVNVLDAQQKDAFKDTLSKNFLDQTFLANILDILDAQMKAQLNLLNTTSNRLLPDYFATSGITVEIDEPRLTLCRDDGSNKQCVTTPTNQNTTIYQTQGMLDFKNRVNNGGGTTITLIQK